MIARNKFHERYIYDFHYFFFLKTKIDQLNNKSVHPFLLILLHFAHSIGALFSTHSQLCLIHHISTEANFKMMAHS